ncbi:UBR1 E3 ubiquitin-protein ligase UBR1 [Candida maltosa Xu316]|uniref:E3 ubiquitin-protein ligase n=1 Tax=Candida maltosa (strain Xu316) TaxID=1245528 RepID=M3JTG7_CANMX|nr:hypothetical protein G210_3627 [Candida maltosa Xu316]
MEFELLKKFLVEVPQKLEFRDSVALKYYIYKVLYYTATNRGGCMPNLFPDASDDGLYDLGQPYEPPSDEALSNPFYKVGKSKYTHAPGKACARPFKSGDRVYRCSDCGFDDTCVLCSHCFNEQDHLGHNVMYYSSSGNNGGICDCGDLEAFTQELNCKCQKLNNDDDASNETIYGMMPALRETMEVCLDYILDVSNYNLWTLPVVHQELNSPNPAVTVQKLSDAGSLPSASYGGAEDINSDEKWVLILWNDEAHNLNEAVDAIKAGTGVSDEKAHHIAREIDHDGYSVLKESTSPIALNRSKKLVEINGLVATIISARDHLRHKIIGVILNWLEDILNSHNSLVQYHAQSYFADLLLSADFTFSKNMSPELLQGVFRMQTALGERLRYFENGMPYNGKLINMNCSDLKSPSNALNLHEPFAMLLDIKKEMENLQGSRLQLLLAFQVRFPKFERNKLKSLLVPYLVKTPSVKKRFAEQVIELYPTMTIMSALTDREEDLCLLKEISSQLFTCPQTVRHILDSNQAGRIIGPLIKLIEDQSSEYNSEKGYKIYCEKALNVHGKRCIKKAIICTFHDLSHFFNPNIAGESVSKFLSPETFRLLVLLFRSFQGFWPLTRKYGEHVERDIFDLEVHWNFSLPILTAIKNLALQSYDNPDADKAVLCLLNFLIKTKTAETKAPGVLKFQVSKQPIGFVNPLNTLLSYFLQYRHIDKFQDLLLAYHSDLVRITDVSLRSVVLGSQIMTGFWIRNGASASRQGTLYFNSVLPEYTFKRDFHLNQIAVLFEDPKTVTQNFLERWELSDWFENKVTYDKTIYEERFFPIVERFLSFVYNLFVERSFFVNETPKQGLMKKLKTSIIYGLCEEATAYSALKNKLDYDVTQLDEFDDVLFEVADYQPPSALVDTGLYRLKESMYKHLDPLSILLDPGEFQIISDVLTKNIEKHKQKKSGMTILVPVVQKAGVEFVDTSIGNFVKTLPFIKLIYKFLQVAIDTSDETYLPHLLHLIHAIILDDEMIYGKKYLNENFVNIPITDLLVTIMESKMSKHICSKAEFLVDQFVQKDQRIIENLAECFGETYMESFKKRKTDLFESEAERKKRQAEERKNKILKKFSKQREKFLDQNKDLQVESHADADTTDSQNSHNLHTCVACGEGESLSKPLGIMASITKAPVFWTLPASSGETLANAFKPWDQDVLLNYNSSEYGVGYDWSETSVLNRNEFEARVLATCGHSIHANCLVRRNFGSPQYPCPLCRNLHDLFIPSFKGNFDRATPLDLLFDPPKHSKYNQIVQSADCNNKLSRLMSVFTKSDYFADIDVPIAGMVEVPTIHLQNKKYLHPGDGAYDSDFDRHMNWSVALANTIRMNEISTRLNGSEGYIEFLSQIPGSTKTLLICMIQLKLLNNATTFEPLSADNTHIYEKEVSQFWNSNILLYSIFNEIVVLFFQTDESLATLARLGMTKLIAIGIKSLIKRKEKATDYFEYIEQAGVEETAGDAEDLAMFDNFLESLFTANNIAVPGFSTSTCKSIYFAMEKIILVFLRQVAIFGDLLTCRPTGENNYESISEFATLNEKIELQERLSDTRALTEALKIPSFGQIIRSLFESSSGLEGNVFDIVWNAKIPRYMNFNILTLDYPGMIHLTNLPIDYNSCILQTAQLSNRQDCKCLLCGRWVKNQGVASHMLQCASQIGIFFYPMSNLLKLRVSVGRNLFSIEPPSPYLTKHGEVKTKSYKGVATLNQFRFAYLNKLWVTQGLYGFVTRTLFGSVVDADTTFNPGFNTNRNDSEDEEDEEEEEEDEDFIRWDEDEDFIFR